MTWTEVAALDRSRLVAILPLGAVEAHGPHLPLATDGVIAGAMAREAARRLAAGGWTALLLPAIDYSAAPFAAGFPGTVSLRPETTTALVEDIGATVAGWGVPVLAIANAHLDPEHLRAVRRAVATLRAAGPAACGLPGPQPPPVGDPARRGVRLGRLPRRPLRGLGGAGRAARAGAAGSQRGAGAHSRLAVGRHPRRPAHVRRGRRAAGVLRRPGGGHRRGGPGDDRPSWAPSSPKRSWRRSKPPAATNPTTNHRTEGHRHEARRQDARSSPAAAAASAPRWPWRWPRRAPRWWSAPAARTRSKASPRACATAATPAWAVPCDVTDPAQIFGLAEIAGERLGRVDILVNNAGTVSSAPLKSLTLETWNHILAVNATGVFLCTKAFLPGMVERGWGRVVNVASIAGKTGGPYISAYAASKHAVLGFTRSVAAEVATTGVTVNAVCPGYVDTPMTDRSVERIVEKTGADPEAVRETMRRTSPQNRLMRARGGRSRGGQPVRPGRPRDERPGGGDRRRRGAVVNDEPPPTVPPPGARPINPAELGAPRGYSNGILAPPGAPAAVRRRPGRLGREPAAGRRRFRRAVRTGPGQRCRRGARGRRQARGPGAADDLRRRPARVPGGARGQVGDAYRGIMGRHYPAMALVEVQALLETGAKVEIEATAALPVRSSRS